LYVPVLITYLYDGGQVLYNKIGKWNKSFILLLESYLFDHYAFFIETIKI